MKLAVLKNNQLVTSVELTLSEQREEFFVGRAEDCHVRLNDPLLSRHHFVIIGDKNQWSIEKMTTVGDLSINGNEIHNGSIHNGDRINFSIYTLIPSIENKVIESVVKSGSELTQFDVLSHEPIIEDLSQTVVQSPNVMPMPQPEKIEEIVNEDIDLDPIEEEVSSSDVMDFNHDEDIIGSEIKEEDTNANFESTDTNVENDSSFQDDPGDINNQSQDNSDKTIVFNTFILTVIIFISRFIKIIMIRIRIAIYIFYIIRFLNFFIFLFNTCF